LRKKSLSILKAPEKEGSYRSLSKMKRSHTVEGEVRLSRTEILKSMLIQYDRSAEELAHARKTKEEGKREKSPFLTDLGEARAKSNGQGRPKVNKLGEESERTSTRRQEGKASLSEEQIEIIVRSSLRESDREREAKGKPAKSLISFTQKSAYMRKMRRVQGQS
jgi:hypothetical protein